MNAIERAAEVIGSVEVGYAYDSHIDTTKAAAALYNAGLLLTDADRAVLDAVDNWRTKPDSSGALMRLMNVAAERARREATS
jgi:hypothetical protein